ncbi:hypothetical protein MKX03_014702 [Papaver bracteatum]|nr:hypothetical protein MKX03_014702 [Papaver bracteatum]
MEIITFRMVLVSLFLCFFIGGYVVESEKVYVDYYTNHQEMMGVQPLSKISMHEIELKVHAEASGQSSEWITVTFKHPHPTADDWVAVFSPATFNASTYKHTLPTFDPKYVSPLLLNRIYNLDDILNRIIPKLIPAETMFYVPAENRANYWYSVDNGMFRFFIGDSEHDWREGDEQYKFIEQCFATADRQKQPWLIFATHRVLGYSSNEPMGRSSLQKLWQKYRVDIAYYGHVHNYERTCPMYENICVNSATTHFSGLWNETIHVVVGGGSDLYKDFDFGFVKMTAFNHTSLLFEYKKSSDWNVYESFTITREYMDVLACTIDSCAPVTLAT